MTYAAQHGFIEGFVCFLVTLNVSTLQEIMAIPELRELDLSYNKLTGSIPLPFMASLSLKLLRINHNLLAGALPSLSGLTKIELFHAQNNMLANSLPVQWPTTLKELDLGFNQFTGFSGGGETSWSDLQSLQTLSLNNNNLTWTNWPPVRGSHPHPASKGVIRVLYLCLVGMCICWGSSVLGRRCLAPDGNILSICVANWLMMSLIGSRFRSQGFKRLTKVRVLNLENNLLRFQFPEFYRMIPNIVHGLVSLDLSGNEVYGDIAQDTRLLFPEFKSLANLDLSNNLLGLTYVQACEHKGWGTASQCNLTASAIPETCRASAGRLNQNCVFHNALPLSLPPLIRTVDFSINFFGDEIPELYATYEMLQNLDVRGNFNEIQFTAGGFVTENDFRVFQWRGNKDLPSFASTGPLNSQTRLKYSDTGGNYSCPLLRLFDAKAKRLWVDPFYYEWQFCACEYGFYPDPIVTPQAPHCTPFPTDLFPEALNGTFTDGDSGGRVRRGLDTQWHVNVDAQVDYSRVLAVTLQFADLQLTNDSTIFTYAGASILDTRVQAMSWLVNVYITLHNV
jgi:hypothetical protein